MRDRAEQTEHAERWHDEIAAYALDALHEREVAPLEHHLDGCEDCAERLRWISPAVDVLPASVVPEKAPPELRERLLAIVAEEAAEAGVASVAVAPRRRRWLPDFGGFGLRPTLAAAAAVLLLVAGVAGYELRNETSTSGTSSKSYAAVSEIPGSNASGTLEVEGDKGSLHVVNLPPAKRGEVYQAWVTEPSGKEGGTIHPSSVFVVSKDGSADVAIPRGNGLEGAEQVMVTREPKGGSKLPSENPLLIAKID